MTEIATRTRAGVYRIEDLVTLVAHGKLRVPEFQRNFRWARQDVLSLFDSIQKGYPVGSLLLWRRRAPEALITIGELRIAAPEVTDAMWVVDGQQRITAIANAVSQDAYDASERFRIDYDLDKLSFVLGGGDNDNLRVPLPVLFDLRRLLEWAQAHPDAGHHIGALNDVAVRLRDFSVAASVVDESDESTLREIFDRTNNAGRKLKRAEVFRALFSDQRDDRMTIEAIADDVPETHLVSRDGAFGIPSQLWPVDEEWAYAIRRFDRLDSGKAVHIEDFAQVRGLRSNQKYMGSFESIGAICYRGADIDSLVEFVRRLVFNVLIGNGDAHLKNWSLIYPDGRNPRLSPAYDLVSTVPYSEQDDLGLKFGGTRRFEAISFRSFERLERHLGVESGRLTSVAAETVASVREAWSPDLLPSDCRFVARWISDSIARSGTLFG